MVLASTMLLLWSMCMTSASGTRGWGQAAGCLTSATTYDLMSPLCSGLWAT